jgi:hypothetical protein
MAVATAAALVGGGLLFAQPASADITTGNAAVECQSAGYEDGVKLDTGGAGTYVYPDDGPWEPDDIDGLELTVTITDSKTFEWSSNTFMDAVLVKRGPGYTVFAGGVEGEEQLTVQFGISHITFCFGEAPEEAVTVEKDVKTSYDRQHDWSLDKSVSKNDVWLYAPGSGGSGTGSVTWAIDVDYEGATDSNHLVYGDITVTNVGAGAVGVVSVTDLMSGMDVAVTCEVDLTLGPAFLEPGEELECSYSQSVDTKVEGMNVATATTLSGGVYDSDEMPISWGDPTNEYDANVKLTDISDIGGTSMDSFSAPFGGSIIYANEFSWDDYEECGDYTYENTATLTSNTAQVSLARVSGPLPLEDSESVTVHVQCLVFDGETAWAANMGPGTDRYNKRGNWATYVTYTGGEKTYNLYAGQTTYVGTAKIEPSGAGVKVTVDLIDGWEYGDGANLKIQHYTSKPSGNPSPGLFASHTMCAGDPCMTGTIPKPAATTYYGIHLDVGQWVPDPDFGP